MNPALDSTGGWEQALAGFGLGVAVRATALLLLAWVLHAALGRRRALARSAVWHACVLGLLLMPLSVLALPRFQVGAMAAPRFGATTEMTYPDGPDATPGLLPDHLLAAAPEEVGGGRATGASPSGVAPADLGLGNPSSSGVVAAKTGIGEAPPLASGSNGGSGVSWPRASVVVMVLAVYGGGFVLLAVRLFGSLVAVGRLRSRSRPVETAAWVEGRDRCAARLGLTHRVALLRTDHVSVPAVVGHFRPAILLPESLADEADPDMIDAVLLHELGHVRRCDFGWNVLRAVAQVVYWPHPLAWTIGRVIGEVREQACDDLCVRGLGGAPAYRAVLVEVAAGLVRRPLPALGLAMARVPSLGRRLAWIDRSPGAADCVLRRPARSVIAAAAAALVGAIGAAEPFRAVAAAQPADPPPGSARPAPPPAPTSSAPSAEATALDKLVAAVRAEEAKYRNIEYALRLTSRKVDADEQDGPGKVLSREVRRVVQQDDRVWFRGERTVETFGQTQSREELSAYDGERTRTVIAGNSANVHLGRFEHPNVYPAHTVPLIHYRLNFPLSVYLSGGEAIHAHPKYGRFVRERGSVAEFTKVEAHVEGEEQVGDLRCVKVRVDRWYYSKDAPARQLLWLATERNYLCVKEQLYFSWAAADLPSQEMRVEELREVSSGVWFPVKVATVDYDGNALLRKKLVADGRTETVVEKVAIDPRHEPAFFRDVPFPVGLPVFTIDGEKLVGSSMPEPVGGEAEERAKLEQIVARVREQEKRCDDLEVKAHVGYKQLRSDRFMEGIIVEQNHALRSVLRGASAYYSKQGGFVTADGTRQEQKEVQAFDGLWTRSSRRSAQDGQPEQGLASLRKGGGGKAEGRHDGVPVLRPHTFLLRDDSLYGPLADLLISPWHDRVNKYRLRFRYCGEEVVDGRPCVRLRGEVTTGEGRPPHNYMAVWLATDRNYIPVKLEHYGGNSGLRPIPSGVSRCDDFREIAPGVWYPFRSLLLAFDTWGDMPSGRLSVNWRREYEVQSATLSPGADAALFHDIVLPAKTTVQVVNEDGGYTGEYEQVREGVAEVTPARYLALQSEAKVRDEAAKARQRAIDALIGKPAPEFPAGATWLNGGAQTWASLRGKVVVLDFWAEWCGPCRADFPQLSLLHDARETNGLTIVGVHPPGSTAEAMKKVTDEFHLGYPTCVDTVPPEGMKAWGDLFGRFAVHAIPHAVVVDTQGVIVAAGRLQDIIPKAVELTRKR